MRKGRVIALFCALLCMGMGLLPRNSQVPEAPAPIPNTTLSIGCAAFGGLHSPFFAVSESDRDVVELTQIRLLNTDRSGKVICNGIEGETVLYGNTEYTYTGPADVAVNQQSDGSVEYAFTLREDITFSDGTALTAKDVIFSMYVLCDPTYNGPSTFAELPIQGLREYHQNVVAKWQLILDATPANAAVGSPEGYYTAAEAIEFWTLFNEAGADFATEIIEDGIARGIAENIVGVAESLGYMGLTETSTPTDLFNMIVDSCGYALSDTGINAVAVKNDFSALLTAKLTDALKKGVVIGDSALRISGIRQTGEYTFTVTLTQPDVTALHQFCMPIAPLHYYGNLQLFAPESGSFGFAKGDLSGVRSKTSGKPLGAGPYVYTRYHNGTVTLKANETYYRGVPKTAEILVKAVGEPKKLAQLSENKVQFVEVDMTPSIREMLEKTNGGVLSGDAITVDIVDRLGYGFIGMNPDRIRVGGSSDSSASRYLRRALATLFAAYRETSVTEYYGDYGSVVAPDTFITDADGIPIKLGNVADEDYRARLTEAVLEYFKLAGYTVQDGQIVDAPEGGSLHFSMAFIGHDEMQNPVLSVLTQAQELLAELGITLTLYDYRQEGVLIRDIQSGKAPIWCYFREFVPTENGGEYYGYSDVSDDKLEELLAKFRGETDSKKRSELYKKIQSHLLTKAVEVPLYQKKTVILINTPAINIDTLTKDITPYYGWEREIETLELKG